MSDKLILANTEMEQWLDLVREAEAEFGCRLDESMESYLVFTLMRFMSSQDLATQALALDYLKAHGLPKSLRVEQLRDIGDQCLLLSGLYPKRAEHFHVRISYYVDMGRAAYSNISDSLQHAAAELYRALAEAFVTLMDLLQTIAGLRSPALQPLQAYELWSDTGSRSLANQLGADCFPVSEQLVDLKTRQ